MWAVLNRAGVNAGRVDLIVFLVRADKSNEYDLEFILDGDDHTLLVAPDIKDHLVVRHTTGIPIFGLDVRWGFPGGAFDVGVPGFES